jgi:hypothetical protein
LSRGWIGSAWPTGPRPAGPVRLAPPTHGKRDSPVDMRHRSTPGDRPTVRVGVPQGQTSATPRPEPAGRVFHMVRESLWMTGCRGPGTRVRFERPRFPRVLENRRIDKVCDPRHTGRKRAPDLRKLPNRWAPDASRTDSVHSCGVGFTPCGQTCGDSAVPCQAGVRTTPGRRPGAKGGGNPGGAVDVGPGPGMATGR